VSVLLIYRAVQRLRTELAPGQTATGPRKRLDEIGHDLLDEGLETAFAF
jgi:hypothetical protein